MIPKIIHYCWFGRSKKPKIAEKCISSWKKYFPDFEIIEWNEDNFDLNYNTYTAFCYENKKWAYLSDLVRLIVVAKYGGIYFDTDVEVIKSFDNLLYYDAFYAFENKSNVATGLGFGSIANHPVLLDMIKIYDDIKRDETGNIKFINCPVLNTKALMNYGLQLNGKLQNLDRVCILSPEYMNPYDDSIGKLQITDHTISIHWYTKSAFSTRKKIRNKLTKPIHRLVRFLKNE